MADNIWGPTPEEIYAQMQKAGPVYGPRTAVDEWMASTPWATQTTASAPTIPGGLPPELETYTDPNTGIIYYRDAAGEWRVAGQGQGGSTMSAADQAAIDLANRKFAFEQANYPQEQAMAQQQAWQTTAYQQQQLAAEQQWRQQQLQQEQQQRLATLAANPKSWLEYAATANQQPVIQPWMLPLMPQEYAGANLPAAGATIPGWNAQNMQGMPNLINPSAQYWARMGPTAQQQYYGYQQADQAMTPEESQFRMWNMAPPRGRMSFSQVR